MVCISEGHHEDEMKYSAWPVLIVASIIIILLRGLFQDLESFFVCPRQVQAGPRHTCHQFAEAYPVGSDETSDSGSLPVSEEPAPWLGGVPVTRLSGWL